MELKGMGTVASAVAQDEASSKFTSTSSIAPSLSIPSLLPYRAMPPTASVAAAAKHDANMHQAPVWPRVKFQLHKHLQRCLNMSSSRTAVFICFAAILLTLLARYAPYFATLQGSTACEAELVAFLRRLKLSQYARALCSKGYTRLADVLHMTHDMLRDEVEILVPAHRHRILYTSADMLTQSQMQRQAFVEARARSQHAWGLLSVLFVAMPLLMMCGTFVAAAAALSVPEVRSKVFVALAVATSEVWYHFNHNRRDADGDASERRSNAARPSHECPGDTEAGFNYGAPAAAEYGPAAVSGERSFSSRVGGGAARRERTAAAPTTPDTADALRQSEPVRAVSSGGGLSSGGRTVGRAGSAAVAAFAALAPRRKHRSDLTQVPGAEALPAAAAAAEGVSHTSSTPSFDIDGDWSLVPRTPASGIGALGTSIGATRLPQMILRASNSARLSVARPVSNSGSAVLHGWLQKQGECGPVGEASGAAAHGIGLLRQTRHVFRSDRVTHCAPAAVEPSSSGSSSSSSGSSGSNVKAGRGNKKVRHVTAAEAASLASQAVASEAQGGGEIDVALGLVSDDSEFSRAADGCGSADGATVSLSSWQTGIAVQEWAEDSVEQPPATGSGSAGAYTHRHVDAGEKRAASKSWRSALRRLQRGNDRMLQLLRRRGHSRQSRIQ